MNPDSFSQSDQTVRALELAKYNIESLWLRPEPATRRLLIVYAHPDDESFGNAGSIARYAAAGVAVHYACATRGECGTVAPALLEGYADIAELRTAELTCAAKTLGLAGVHMLGYRDSGMQGAPENLHARALTQAPLEQVTKQLVALMRALQPQVVVTFSPYGGYGHPDHIAIHHATHAAFGAANDGERYPEQDVGGLKTWAPQKLYYSTFGVNPLRVGIAVMRLLRKDPRRFGENNDVDLLRVVEEITPITTSVTSRAFHTQKERAWRCHRSQIGGMERMLRLPAVVQRGMLSTEHFTRIVPAWNARQPRERDLFAKIQE